MRRPVGIGGREVIAGVAALAGTGLAGCTQVETTVHEPLPAVEIVDGADDAAPKTLTLTADAVRRLELRTVVVVDPGAIPFAAVVYDKKGAPWVYSTPGDRVFVRVPVTIARIDDETARLSAGPPVGTRIATGGAIKLYGAENGVGGGH
ncbi:MAG: hypothetical protein ACRCYR_01735 [Phycicoccus sp.]